MKCQVCGNDFNGHQFATLCPECKRERTNARMRDYYAKNKTRLSEYKREHSRKSYERINGMVTIIADPIPVESGGFKPGVTFPGEQVQMMAAYGSLTDGAVIQKKDGTRQVVRGGKLVRVSA